MGLQRWSRPWESGDAPQPFRCCSTPQQTQGLELAKCICLVSRPALCARHLFRRLPCWNPAGQHDASRRCDLADACNGDEWNLRLLNWPTSQVPSLDNRCATRLGRSWAKQQDAVPGCQCGSKQSYQRAEPEFVLAAASSSGRLCVVNDQAVGQRSSWTSGYVPEVDICW